jgi:predicted Rossmann-fold nucleotide-binding protein
MVFLARGGPVIVLACGSRTWTDAETIRRRLGQLRVDHGDIVITGGAPGADTIAGSVAYRLGLHVATMPALWHVHGKTAGPWRNAAMFRLRPDLVIAFSHGTRGTQDTIERARVAGVPVEVHGWEAT